MRRRIFRKPLICVKFAGLVVLLVTNNSITIYASTDQTVPDNWREKCRQIVSGQYLQHFDSKHQFSQQEKQLETQIARMTSELNDTRTQFDQLEAKTQNSEFDKDEANQLHNLRAKLKLQESLLADKKSAIAKTRERLESAAGKLERYIAKVEPIFRIDQKKPEEADPGYGIRLEFRSPCPKHRHVCPLPVADAQKLRDLTLDIEGADACVKYSQIKQ
jgi:hypothetical protein